MREEAKVAIVGGGIAACSLAYHLARLGWDDVVLLEQDELTSGSTWHAAGLCTQFNSSYTLMRLLRYSVELYRSLEAETGQPVNYHACGSLRLAATRDRLDEFRQRAAMAELVGVPFEFVGTERLAGLNPLLDTRGLLEAAYLPTDGHVDPTGLTTAFVRGASDLRVRRRTPVTAIRRERGSWLLETPVGHVRAEIVVNAAGQWAPAVARLVGGDLPLVSLQHHYVVTEPIAELAALERELPVLRDADASSYVRQEGGGLLVGPFERDRSRGCSTASRRASTAGCSSCGVCGRRWERSSLRWAVREFEEHDCPAGEAARTRRAVKAAEREIACEACGWVAVTDKYRGPALLAEHQRIGPNKADAAEPASG